MVKFVQVYMYSIYVYLCNIETRTSKRAEKTQRHVKERCMVKGSHMYTSLKRVDIKLYTKLLPVKVDRYFRLYWSTLNCSE